MSDHFSTAHYWAKQSQCLKRQYGAVMVNDGVVVGYGYNISIGEPCTKCSREHRYLDPDYTKCKTVHAEQVALIGANPWELNGADIYLVSEDRLDVRPCPICLRMLKHAGVKHLIVEVEKGRNVIELDDL